jgi:hypothetical protein
MKIVIWITLSLSALGMLCIANSAPGSTSVQAPVSDPTYNKEIAPILDDDCLSCHRPGGSGPFSLTAYGDVKRRARQIAEVTASRYMPPWLPEPGYGKFLGEHMLTEPQIRTIQRWAEAGSPEGAASHPPPLPKTAQEVAARQARPGCATTPALYFASRRQH